ncbi:NigD1/NigD2 family lipoprotein [Coprobacter tertius]|uniref:NigD-like protein n=1 Tax=Coprobacter tertius TaxID=2944915 RepID=A0ABT1MFM2_9BACT|nr:NigD-like C-terminal domain-containing protein [Coprobacter tertius]MCP9610478.1 NigD-like protein [Coprobacter tertius]
MKKRKILYLSIFCYIAFTLSACDKEETFDYGPFRIDMVTCETGDGTLSFLRDDGCTLVPSPSQATDNYVDGQRVLLNYIVIEKNTTDLCTIQIKSLGKILYNDVKTIDYTQLSMIPDDPIYLVTAWEGGNCINLKYKIEYNSMPHYMQLFYTPELQSDDDTLRLQLRHDKNNDLPGYPTPGYASFRYSALPSANLKNVIKVYINTSNITDKFYTFTLN